MSLRLRSKKYLLTWSRAEGLVKSAVLDHLRGIGEITYAVVSEEEHEDGGKHFHAVVLFANALNTRTNVFSLQGYVCNIRVIQNTNADLMRAINYVKEDGDFIEIGERPASVKRIERREKIEFIKNHSTRECIESGHFSLSEIRNIDFIKSHLMEKREDRPRIVYWLWGATGTGKTRRAWELARAAYNDEEIWFATGNLREFKNGYTGQRCVIFDDFRNGDIKFNELLALTDRYPCNVNIKGGWIHWKADVIIFTSPNIPEETFLVRDKYNGDVQPREDIAQIIRRIDFILEIEENQEGQIP